LGRLLSQIEEPLFVELVLPFLPHIWRQLGAVPPRRLSFQNAFERRLRELFIRLLVQLAHFNGRICPCHVPLNDVTAILQ